MNSSRISAIVPDGNPFLGASGDSKLLDWKLYVTNDGLFIPFLISNFNPHYLNAMPNLDIEELIDPLGIFSAISTND